MMIFKLSRNISTFGYTVRHFCCTNINKSQGFPGVLCDIDGVLLRGRNIIPGARESIKILYDKCIPVVFLTNQGLQSEEEKAESLSKILEIKVKPEQVVLSHSPIHFQNKLADKFILVVGQQNINATAKSLGFKNICDIDDIRTEYPLLDMVDKERRYEKLYNSQTKSSISDVEGIVLLGEPVRWECVLQLCIDLLVSNGNPSRRLDCIPREHIPVVACNTDLLWMAEAPLPRFGHGAFLLCLQALYEVETQKITGNSLKYSLLTGKPFLITYKYAERLINTYLRSKHDKPTNCLKRIYVIGDNPDTDIYGGNIYKQYIKHSPKFVATESDYHSTVEDVISILVATGVHSKGNLKRLVELPDHVHKDIVFQPQMRTPDHNVENISDAVRLILENETISNNF